MPIESLEALTQEEIEKIEDCLKNPAKYNIPSFSIQQKKGSRKQA